MEDHMLRNYRKRMGWLFLTATFLVLRLFSLQAFAADPLATWHVRSSVPQANTFNNMIYANGLYVAVGANGAVTTSKDQISWTSQTLVTPGGSTEPWLNAVTYGGGLFVAVGTYIWTSPDGLTWTYRPCPVGPFYAVAYGNGRYVAAGGLGGSITSNPGPPVLATSEDGITWTDRSSTSGVTAEPTKGLIFAGGLFVQVAWHQLPYYSTDGLTFVKGLLSNSSAQETNHCVGFAYGNGTFLMVGGPMDSSYGGSIFTSKDGITWTRSTGPFFATLGADQTTHVSLATNLAFGNGVFMGIEEDQDTGPYNTYTSTDGVTWTAHPISGAWGNAIAASAGYFTLVYDSGAIYTTADDGVTWKLTSSLIQGTAAAYGNGMFVTVGLGGTSPHRRTGPPGPRCRIPLWRP